MSLVIRAARGRAMGDPGLFDFLKKAGSAVLGGVSGLLTGGPLGAIKGAVTPFIAPRSVVPGASTSPVLLPAVPMSGQSALPGIGTQTGSRRGFEIEGPFGMGFRAGQETFLPQGGGVQPGQQTGTQMCRLPSGGIVMRPTHANKSGYFLKSGQFVAPGTKCVTNRRMNPLNPRALHKAMTRLVSAKRAASFMSRISIRGSGPSRRRSSSPSRGRACGCKRK